MIAVSKQTAVYNPYKDLYLHYSMSRIGEHKDVGCYTVEGGKHIIKSSYRRQPRTLSFEVPKSLKPYMQALLWFSSVQFSSVPFSSVVLVKRKLIKA